MALKNKKIQAADSRAAAPWSQGSPQWLFPLYIAGLAMVYLGERVLPGVETVRWLLSALGCLSVVAAVTMRWWAASATQGQHRIAERMLAVLSTLGLVALLLYFTTAEPFDDWLGIGSLRASTRGEYVAVVTVVWVVLQLASTISQLLAEVALYPMRRAEHVEWRRVRAALLAGLTVALAASYGALFTYAGDRLELKADFSYFRTSRPSESTLNILREMTDPVRVVGFFPPVNEVRTEAKQYLDALAGNDRVQVELHDRLMMPDLAKDARVTQDGVIVLIRGEQRETITLGSELKNARPKLKRLDEDFQKSLMKVLRVARTAYLTIGHGELNDSKPTPDAQGRSAQAVREFLGMQNYVVRDLGAVQGLAKDVPEDATTVFILGPTQPFAPEEMDALKRYLQRNGRILMALDPESKTDLNGLAELVGLSFHADVLCNEQTHAVRRRNASDNAILITNKFSIHPSVSTLSRVGSWPVFVLNAGYLVRKDDADKELKIDFTVRSMPNTFADLNGNFTLDAAEEKQSTYNIAAAISRAGKSPADKDATKNEMRVAVIADVDALSDAALLNPNRLNGNPQLLADIVRWLGGEEQLSGLVSTPEDVRIEHTKQKDTILFYSTIFGAPALVLGFGLLYSRRVRSSSTRKKTA